MPGRGSFSHKDAMSGFGFQEGYVEVNRAVVAVHQFPPNSKTGLQSDPFTAVRFSCTKLNEDYSEPDNPDIVDIIIRLGKLDSIRPGNVDTPDAEDVQDEGSEVDTEGNTAYFEDGARVSSNWGDFEASLVNCGFRPEISGRGYFPDFVGLKCHLKTVETGSYTDKKMGEEKKSTALVCDQINTFPYDKPKAKGGSKTGAAKGGAKTGGAAKTEAADDGGDDGVKEKAMEALTNLTPAFFKVVKPNVEVKRALFQTQMHLELTRQKAAAADKKAIIEFIKDDALLEELAAEMGTFALDLENGTVLFPGE